VISLRAGDRLLTKEVELLGMPVDRGIYRSGMSAKAGDGVTYGGSYWIAKQDTDESPTGPSHHWRLAVKGSK
jgi:integrin beta 3